MVDRSEILTNPENCRLETQSPPEQLPIAEYKEEIQSSIIKNTVTILVSPTGTGKTTQVPTYAFETEIFDEITVTQPRIIAARELSNRVIFESEDRTKVGYYTSRESSGDNQRDQDIAFLTDGKAAKQMLSGRNDNDKRKLLVIDEVHEWNEHTELLIALANDQTDPKSPRYNPNLKVVIMSATMDGKGLKDFFAHTATGFIEVTNPSKFTTKEHYRNISPDQAILERLDEKHDSKILTFLPGVSEIRNTRDQLLKAGVEKPIIALHGKLSKHQQGLATKEYPDGVVILSTNVAETSITITDVDCVIDTGMQRINNINYSLDPTGTEELNLQHAPESSVIQRGGRTSRTCNGVVIYVSPDGVNPPLTRNERRKMQEFQTPAIHRSRLDSLILSLIDAEIDIKDLNFYHEPNDQAINASKIRLFNMGAMDEFGKSTRRGRIMNRIPLDPELACMLAIARENKVGNRAMSTLVTITAIAGLGGIFDRSPERQAWKALLDKDEYGGTKEKHSDFFSQLEAYVHLKTKIPEEEWKNYQLNEHALGLIERDRQAIASRLDIDLLPPLPINHNDRSKLLEIINLSRVNQIWQRKNDLWVNVFTDEVATQTASSTAILGSGKVATGSYFRLGLTPTSDTYSVTGLSHESVQDMNAIRDIKKFAKQVGHLVTEQVCESTLNYDMLTKKWTIEVWRKIGNLILDNVVVDAESIKNRPSNEQFSKAYRIAALQALKSDKSKQRQPVGSLSEAISILDQLEDQQLSQESENSEKPRFNGLISTRYGYDAINDEWLYAYLTAQGKWTPDIEIAIKSFRAKIRYLHRKPAIMARKEEKKAQAATQKIQTNTAQEEAPKPSIRRTRVPLKNPRQ